MIASELTVDVLFTLAADAASAQAGLELVRKNKLSQLRISRDVTRLAGQCAGSDPGDSYQVHVDLSAANPGSAHYAACNCPSMKRPCKHALGLLAAYIQQPEQFDVHEVPQPAREAADAPGIVVRRRQPVAPAAVPQPTFDEATASFLQTILAAPDDTAARLVYADWLEEHHDLPRAEFIRLQCTLDRLGDDDPGRAALARREECLLKQHRQEWLGPLPLWLRRMQPVFRRGFVEEITTTAHLLLKYAAALFAAAPIRTVHLELVAVQGHSAAAHASALAGSAFLERLAALDLSSNAPAVAGKLRGLLHTPFLKNLQSLNLSGLPLAHHHLDAVTTPYLASLQRLELRATGMGPAALRLLAAWPGLRQLTWLDLRGNRCGTDGARLLAASPHLGAALTLLVSPDIGPAAQATLRERLGAGLHMAAADP